MKPFCFIVILILPVLYSCNKETVEDPLIKQEHFIIAGDKGPANDYFDYIPDFTMDIDFNEETWSLSASFDMNEDSIPDLVFYNSCEIQTYIDETTRLEGTVKFYSTAVQVINADSLRISPPFLEGDTIDKEADWYSSLNLISCTDIGGCDIFGGRDMNDLYPYMGVCIYTKNDTLYGWLLLRMNITVYEAALNKPE